MTTCRISSPSTSMEDLISSSLLWLVLSFSCVFVLLDAECEVRVLVCFLHCPSSFFCRLNRCLILSGFWIGVRLEWHYAVVVFLEIDQYVFLVTVVCSLDSAVSLYVSCATRSDVRGALFIIRCRLASSCNVCLLIGRVLRMAILI